MEDLVEELAKQEELAKEQAAANEDAEEDLDSSSDAAEQKDRAPEHDESADEAVKDAVDAEDSEGASEDESEDEQQTQGARQDELPSEEPLPQEKRDGEPKNNQESAGEVDHNNERALGAEPATNRSAAEPINEPASPLQDEVYAQKDTADPNASLWTKAKSFVFSHKTAALVVAGLLLVLLVVAVVHKVQDAERLRMEAETEAAYAQSLRTPRPVAVELEIDNYNEEHMTPIPLRVTGTSTSGESVDEVQLVTPQDSELMLLPGSYSVKLEGRPVSDEGVLYNGSIDTFALEVSAEDEATDAKQESKTDKPQKTLLFVFAPIAPQNIREADVEAARAWMKAANFEKADAFADAVANSRNEALEHIEQEQASREEEGLKKVEDTTRQIEKEIADRRKKKQQQNGQTNNQQNGSGSQNGYDEYGNETGAYSDWYGYDSYGDSYDSTYGWANPWGY